MTKFKPASLNNALNTSSSLLALAFPALSFLVGDTSWIVSGLAIIYLTSIVLNWSEKKIDSMAILALASITILIGEYYWHINTVSFEIFKERFPSKYLNFFFCFFLIAYGTAAQKKNPFWILISAAVGLILYIAFKIPAVDWLMSWQGNRPSFGFRNAQHSAVVFATGLICICFFSHRLYCACKSRYKLLLSIGLIFFILFLLWVTIASQTRGVWLGLIIASIITFLHSTIIVSNKFTSIWEKNHKGILLGIVGIAACISIFSSIGIFDRISKRLSSEAISYHTIEKATHFNEKQLSSTGIRIASWRAAIDWGLERPIAGWGYRSVEILMAKDHRFSNPEWRGYGHLHNSYFEAWIASGFIGIALMLSVIIHVAIRTIQLWQQNKIPNDVFLFSWAFISFWLTVNCFESYINYSTGLYITSIIAGFIYAYCLQDNHINEQEN
jgi:O-antigen ligase